MFAPVPVFVVAGPQGAGKTTLINHLLRHSADTRFGIIVNDFGDVDLDGLLVTGQADTTLWVAGGCLCCSGDDAELARHLARFTAPRARIDVVVVEASGAADPTALIARASAGLGRRAVFAGLIVLVDAEHPDAPGSEALEQQVAPADLVVITKADRVPDDAVADVRSRIRAAVGRRPVVEVRHGALDPTLLLDLRHEPFRQLTLGDIHAGDNAHLHPPLRTVSWREERPLHPRRLAGLLGEGVPEAFRITGLVEIAIAGLPRRWTVHRVGRHVRITPGAPGRRRGSRLVLRGPALDGAAYDALRELVPRPEDEPDLHDLAALERFVPARHRLSTALLALDDERALEAGA